MDDEKNTIFVHSFDVSDGSDLNKLIKIFGVKN